MISDLPAEVNGQEEWNWNERQVDRATPGAGDGDADRQSEGTQREVPPDQAVAAQRKIQRLEAEIGALEAELEHRQQRLEHVIERYEQVLARKDQQLAEQEESASRQPLRLTIRSVLSRLTPGRR
ncbi:hypothetical protein [Halorubrum sp. N11]|uniref:hypothetical protein n=1 Tax=Halorubrum sp. N11 TaxID=3402276 RepID=UPI003EB88686